ncbi:hypothetical protein L6452_00075 [Arctium lappa]|uniref:Uncharacterized protein n=1 Tax=Arctium lappa TaxID=4217 RepID=A0ACB9FCZ7_ARCLA|nr:hypothetical protein L6452_00075 [Arctium lappa]
MLIRQHSNLLKPRKRTQTLAIFTTFAFCWVCLLALFMSSNSTATTLPAFNHSSPNFKPPIHIYTTNP